VAFDPTIPDNSHKRETAPRRLKPPSTPGRGPQPPLPVHIDKPVPRLPAPSFVEQSHAQLSSGRTIILSSDHSDTDVSDDSDGSDSTPTPPARPKVSRGLSNAATERPILRYDSEGRAFKPAGAMGGKNGWSLQLTCQWDDALYNELGVSQSSHHFTILTSILRTGIRE
jgi:hypothetical protein